ncbi:hypothetical protein [Tunturiibacter gelidiferens]|uniref:hypothetical protein n=1 Tax=Tunturiibacter gelidiferens TaxID=3069689 RepID=UPI003D9B5A3A
MECERRVIGFPVALLATLIFTSSWLIAAQEESNPAKEKFQQDLKAAVMDQSITVPQLKEIQGNLAILKEAKSEQQPGAPIDLMTLYTAVSKIRAIMATVTEPDRGTLRQDFQLMLATRQPAPSTEPDTPGKNLAKTSSPLSCMANQLPRRCSSFRRA